MAITRAQFEKFEALASDVFNDIFHTLDGELGEELSLDSADAADIAGETARAFRRAVEASWKLSGMTPPNRRK